VGVKRSGPCPTELRSPTGRPENGRRILGANIRRLRLQKGWSQEALAARDAIHRTYMGSVERFERNVAIGNICRIAWALGVNAFELLKE
jgi:transcriptional regulator with XRE-family HTH domain